MNNLDNVQGNKHQRNNKEEHNSIETHPLYEPNEPLDNPSLCTMYIQVSAGIHIRMVVKNAIPLIQAIALK